MKIWMLRRQHLQSWIRLQSRNASLHQTHPVFLSQRSAMDLTRPMVGMHFFNPADRMKLIEVIAGVNTPAETVDAIKKIAEEIGKTPVQVNEAAGFVVNRILIPMINEAAFIKMEGVSDIAGIDTAMKLGANHPMGPLELGDFIGLDICLAIMDVLYKETGDSKYRACPLIRKMVRGGNLRRKERQGLLCIQCRPYQDPGRRTVRLGF